MSVYACVFACVGIDIISFDNKSNTECSSIRPTYIFSA